MKKVFWILSSFLIAAIFTIISCSKEEVTNDEIAEGSRLKATGECTKSGTTWTGKVDGVTKYTGTSMFDCVNTVINNMSSGRITIKNSGESGPGKGDIYAIKPKSSMTLDFSGCTINCNGDDYIVPVQADNKSNITVKNLKVTGRARYVVWFRTCSNIRFENITIGTTWGMGLRVDNSKGGASTGVYISGVTCTSCGSHAVETYGVSGCTITTVNASNTASGCAVLLNQSTNNTVGTVNGYRCNQGGGYAAFRVANSNRSTTCSRVTANECGRGFFSVSSSSNCTVGYIDARNCTSHGVFIENSSYTNVNGGTVSGCNPNVQHVNATSCRTVVNGQTYTAANGKW
jgi:hypothetical protein